MLSSVLILSFILSGGYMPTSKTTAGRARVESVLGYFVLMERAASLHNDRDSMHHYQQCWLMVHERFFGCSAFRPKASAYPATDAAACASTARPRWFIEKYSRPLKRVVGRVSRRSSSAGADAGFLIVYDVLECGHQVECHTSITGERPARHRRCAQCARGGSINVQSTSEPVTRSRAS